MKDDDRVKGVVSASPLYRTSLGDALLPGDSFFTRQLRSRFSEMLVGHLAAGGSANLIALSEALGTFIPGDISAEPDPFGWDARSLLEWEEEQRPQIFAALEAFFLDGGHERRIATQHEFIRGLWSAGVKIEGAALLTEELAYAGDWHEVFLSFAETGRQFGVRLLGGDIDDDALHRAARKAGFSALRAKMIRANVRAIPVLRPKNDH